MQPLLAVLLLYSSPDNSLRFLLDHRSRQVTKLYISNTITVLPRGTFLPGPGSGQYAPGRMINHARPGDNWTIYPVPVKDVLNLRYDGKETITGVINVIIRHINGRVFHKLRFASLSRLIQIPVSNLGSGTYDITVVINSKVEWFQRFVK